MNLQYSQAGAIMTQRTDDVGKLILRLGVGGLMFFHGLAKTRDPSFVIDTVTDAGLPGWIGYSVFLGEIVAPLLLIIGLFTRAAAVLVAIDMIAAIALVHADEVTSLTRTGGLAIELELLYLIGAVTIALVGPGRLAAVWTPRRDLVTNSEPISARG